MDGIPIDGEGLAGGPGLRRVAAAEPAPGRDLGEAEVVGDLLALGVEHAAVAVPDLLVLEPLTLLDHLAERCERRLEPVTAMMRPLPP